MVPQSHIQRWSVLIFVSLGANPHPFNRLVKKIDELVKNSEIKEEVVLQVGTTKYEPQSISRVKKFWGPGEYEEILKSCSLIVSHAGLGNVIMARQYKKPLIVVPRLKEHGEHIDNHQVEIAKYLQSNNFCHVVYDIERLSEAIKKAKDEGFKFTERKQPKIIGEIKKYVEAIMAE